MNSFFVMAITITVVCFGLIYMQLKKPKNDSDKKS